MAKVSLKAGTTSYIAQIFIQDSSSTTGAGLTGLTNASSGLTAYYHRDTDTTATAISLVTMTVGTFTSAGFKEIDATNMPGWYQLCLPNAALASGAKNCGIHLKGATNMAPLALEIELTAIDNQDGVRYGMTALPNVASGSAGSIPTTGTGANQISLSSGQVLVQAGSGTGQLDLTSGVVKSNLSQVLGTALTEGGAGRLATALKTLLDVATPVLTAASVNQTGDAYARLGAPAGASTAADIAAIKSDTGALKTDVETTGVKLTAADSFILQTGTAAAGTASTITIASAIGADSRPNGCIIKITSGTGAGQARGIVGYVDATKVITVDRNWTTTPDATSVYTILYASVAKLDTSEQVTAASVQGNVTGSVASVSGAVGSVTANVNTNANATETAIKAVTDNLPNGGALTNLDAAVSSRLAAASITLTGGQVSVDAGSKTGLRLSVTGIDDLWAYAESSIGTAGSIGLKLKNTLPQRITKNTALAKFPFVMVDSTDHLTPKTGLTVTAQRSIDGAAWGGCANSVVEVGNGVYAIDLAASDLNGTTIALRFTATAADTRLVTLITEPAAA